MGSSFDDPEASYRRGYQQGAYSVIRAAEERSEGRASLPSFASGQRLLWLIGATTRGKAIGWQAHRNRPQIRREPGVGVPPYFFVPLFLASSAARTAARSTGA